MDTAQYKTKYLFKTLRGFLVIFDFLKFLFIIDYYLNGILLAVLFSVLFFFTLCVFQTHP